MVQPRWGGGMPCCQEVVLMGEEGISAGEGKNFGDTEKGVINCSRD